MKYFGLMIIFAAIGVIFAKDCKNLNEDYNDCGTACPKSCKNYTKTHFKCEEVCVQGCFCKDGFVRNNIGKCVLIKDCKEPNEQCEDPNEIWNSCGTACPATCKNYQDPPLNCTKQCVQGCFCKNGFVRNDDGKCVLTKDCKDKQCKDPNELWNSCGTACPLTCKNYKDPPPHCTKQCVQDCFCTAPYVRDEASGKCVNTNDCFA